MGDRHLYGKISLWKSLVLIFLYLLEASDIQFILISSGFCFAGFPPIPLVKALLPLPIPYMLRVQSTLGAPISSLYTFPPLPTPSTPNDSNTN